MIYILGFNGFIAKHFYLVLKKKYPEIILLSHGEVIQLKKATSNDIVINCCGVNRAGTKEDYENGNYDFVVKVCEYLTDMPYLLHLSSLMVYGFKDLTLREMSDYQQWFIKSKLKGENYLVSNYDNTKLSIIRPSNVYGYDCKPYYNNLLSTMVYEKINHLIKISSLNKNCIRNMISVEGLVNKMLEIISNKKCGIYNIISSNDKSLEEIAKSLYSDLPDHIKITDDAASIPDIDKSIKGDTIIVSEDFDLEIKNLENRMKSYYDLVSNVTINQRNRLCQSRGDMVEITALKSKRLYKITINKHSVRGNHYHYKQIEDFYINRSKVLFLLALNTSPNVVHMFVANQDDLITINPSVIHTVCNDFNDNIPEIIISSTQEYIPNEIPDTKYIELV